MRTVGRVAAVVVLLGVGLVLWAGTLRLDVRPVLAQLGAFRVQVAGAVLVAGVALLLVPRRPVRVFGAALALLAVSTLPQLLPRLLADPPATPAGLTILSLNVRLDHVAPAAVAEVALARGADVVALPEATPGFAAAVAQVAAAAGVDYRTATDGPAVPETAGSIRPGAEGPYPTSLLVRASLRPVFRGGSPDTRPGVVVAALPVDAMTIAAVHTSAPVPGAEPVWSADHDALATLCAAGGPVVLAGDFNATLDQSPLRRVLAAGCRDAAELTGQGLRGTWPVGAPAPLRIPIDHVLLGPAAGGVASYDVVTVRGSDHRGLLVRLSPNRNGAGT